MSRKTWKENPTGLNPTCHCAILPLTLKSLKDLAEKYRRSTKISWHYVQFQYITVVARVLQVQPQFVISDNTSIYEQKTLKHNFDKNKFFKTIYYRFYFELTPYTSSQLQIVKVEEIKKSQILAHMMSTITQELYGRTHKILVDKAKENEEVYKNKDLNIVRDIIRQLKEFTIETIKQKTILNDQAIQNVLAQLAQNGQIGDFGSFYEVINIAPSKSQQRKEPMEIQNQEVGHDYQRGFNRFENNSQSQNY